MYKARILSTFDVRPIADILEFWQAELALGDGQVAEILPYGDVVRMLLDPSFVRESSAITIVLVRISDWRSASVSLDVRAGEFTSAITALTSSTSNPTLLVLCPSAEDANDCTLIFSLEQKLISELRIRASVDVVMGQDVATLYSVGEIADPRAERIANIPYTEEFYTALATFIVRRCVLNDGAPIKAIVCDCDNTLWKGIAAEADVHRLVIGPSEKKLHAILLQLKSSGILLCLCSKNEPADVIEAFSNLGEGCLSWSDFVFTQVNWERKSASIDATMAALDFAPESVVVLDDSQAECLEIALSHPTVLVGHLPETERVAFLDHYWPLDSIRFGVARGQDRTAMYSMQRERAANRRQYLSFEEYLQNLNLEIIRSDIGPDAVGRAVELMYRTSQFNTSMRRLSEEDLEIALERGQMEGHCWRVKDRFGDYGIVGIALISYLQDAATVESLLLSCRALGLWVERQMLQDIAASALRKGARTMVIPFVTTKRNGILRSFLANLAVETNGVIDESECRLDLARLKELALHPGLDDSPARIENSTEQVETKGEERIRGVRASKYQEIAMHFRDARSVMDHRHGFYLNNTALVAFRNSKDVDVLVRQIFRELLGEEVLDDRKDFVELGGDSMMAVRALSRIERDTGIALPLTTFFEGDASVEGIASTLKLELQGAVEAPCD